MIMYAKKSNEDEKAIKGRCISYGEKESKRSD